MRALKHRREIHDYIIRTELDKDIVVRNYLLDIYTKCESMEDAWLVFDKMPKRHVISWCSIIVGCSQNGNFDESVKLFHRMLLDGIKPNFVTLVRVLPSCGHLKFVKQGKEIHSYIIQNEFESDVFVGSALIDMYAKCGNMDMACQVFNIMP